MKKLGPECIPAITFAIYPGVKQKNYALVAHSETHATDLHAHDRRSKREKVAFLPDY